MSFLRGGYMLDYFLAGHSDNKWQQNFFEAVMSLQGFEKSLYRARKKSDRLSPPLIWDSAP